MELTSCKTPNKNGDTLEKFNKDKEEQCLQIF